MRTRSWATKVKQRVTVSGTRQVQLTACLALFKSRDAHQTTVFSTHHHPLHLLLPFPKMQNFSKSEWVVKASIAGSNQIP